MLLFLHDRVVQLLFSLAENFNETSRGSFEFLVYYYYVVSQKFKFFCLKFCNTTSRNDSIEYLVLKNILHFWTILYVRRNVTQRNVLLFYLRTIHVFLSSVKLS